MQDLSQTDCSSSSRQQQVAARRRAQYSMSKSLFVAIWSTRHALWQWSQSAPRGSPISSVSSFEAESTDHFGQVFQVRLHSQDPQLISKKKDVVAQATRSNYQLKVGARTCSACAPSGGSLSIVFRKAGRESVLPTMHSPRVSDQALDHLHLRCFLRCPIEANAACLDTWRRVSLS